MNKISNERWCRSVGTRGGAEGTWGPCACPCCWWVTASKQLCLSGGQAQGPHPTAPPPLVPTASSSQLCLFKIITPSLTTAVRRDIKGRQLLYLEVDLCVAFLELTRRRVGGAIEGIGRLRNYIIDEHERRLLCKACELFSLASCTASLRICPNHVCSFSMPLLI